MATIIGDKKTTLPFDRMEKTLQLNQNIAALLRMRQLRDTVPLNDHK